MTDLSNYDASQIEYMKEQCILVDNDDNVLGPCSKDFYTEFVKIIDCFYFLGHIVKSETNQGTLHRAFSVFLFDKDNRLLLQQRSEEKITFPSFWANTCCSHPLFVENEMIEENKLGIKNAAKRKLNHELGLPLEEISVDSMKYVTKIQYSANYDEHWGENEIDNIIVMKDPRPSCEIPLHLNANEVQNVHWFTKEELLEFLSTASEKHIHVSPWLVLICKNYIDTIFQVAEQF